MNIVVETSGGVINEVYTDVPGVRVVIIDWDEAEYVAEGVGIGGVLPHVSLDEMPVETRIQYQLATAAKLER